jgi:(2Fe-2S) ferredoxin
MGKEIKVPEKVIYVCNGSSCKKRGGKELRKYFERFADRSNLDIQVIKTGCTDNCKNAPIVCVQPDNHWFGKTDLRKAEEIIGSLKIREKLSPDLDSFPDYDD